MHTSSGIRWRQNCRWLSLALAIGVLAWITAGARVQTTVAFFVARLNEGGNTLSTQTITFSTTPNGGTTCTAGPGTTSNPQGSCGSLLTLSGMVPGDFAIGRARLGTPSGAGQAPVADWLSSSATSSSALDQTVLADGGLGMLAFRCLTGATSASTVSTPADCNTPPGAGNKIYLLPVYPPATSNPCGTLTGATTTDFAGNTQKTLALADNVALTTAVVSTAVAGADSKLSITGAGGAVNCIGGDAVAANIALGGPSAVPGIDTNPPCSATTRGLNAGDNDYIGLIAYLPTAAPAALQNLSSTLRFNWSAEQRMQTSTAACALQLSAGSSQYVKIPAAASLNTGSAITLEAWIKPTGGVGQPILEYNSGSSYGVHMWQFDDSTKLYLNFVDTGGGQHDLMSPANLVASGVWSHVAATYDGSTLDLYVNGQRVASNASAGSFTLQTTYDLYAGARPPGGNFFNGTMDELRVWNVARTQSQIQQNMHASLVGNESGLVAYWRLDDGNGTSAQDSTTDGNTGTLINGPTWVNGMAP